MNHPEDRYLREANAALLMSERAISDDERAAWLRVSQGWLGLIKHPERTAEQLFDDMVLMRHTELGSDEPN
jgi:hypothetical protein